MVWTVFGWTKIETGLCGPPPKIKYLSFQLVRYHFGEKKWIRFTLNNLLDVSTSNKKEGKIIQKREKISMLSAFSICRGFMRPALENIQRINTIAVEQISVTENHFRLTLFFGPFHIWRSDFHFWHTMCVCMVFLSLHFSIPLCEFSILIFFFILHFSQIHNDTDCLHACIFTRNHCPQQQILHGYTMFMKFMLRNFLSLLAPVFFSRTNLFPLCTLFFQQPLA